jgi:hypothetical protein
MGPSVKKGANGKKKLGQSSLSGYWPSAALPNPDAAPQPSETDDPPARQGHFRACALKTCGESKVSFKLAKKHSVLVTDVDAQMVMAKLKNAVVDQIANSTKNQKFIFFCSDGCKRNASKPVVGEAELAKFVMLRDARTEVTLVRNEQQLSRSQVLDLLADGTVSKDISLQAQESMGRALFAADQAGQKLPNWVWVLDPAVQRVVHMAPAILNRLRTDRCNIWCMVNT